MAPPCTTLTKLCADHPGARQLLAQRFGPELVARLLDLERELTALLDRELPNADPALRARHAGGLAHRVATDAWFAEIAAVQPAKVARALDQAHKAAGRLLRALDALPASARCGLHMRLLSLDLPAPAMRQALAAELAYRTIGRVEAGLNSRKTAAAELAGALAETRDGTRAIKPGKHRVDRLTRHAGDIWEALKGERPPVSGTGAGGWGRIVAAVLGLAGLADASGADAARREAERRHAAPAQWCE